MATGHPFLLLLFLSALYCCNNRSNETDPLLRQPPFDKLTDSIQRQSDRADLYYRRGVLLYRQNQWPLAEADLRRAWQLSKDESHALGLIQVLEKKHPDSALRFATEAARMLPQSIAVQVSLAKALKEKANLPEALRVSNEIIAKHPNALDALILKAEILTSLNQQQEALQTLETAYAYAPFDVELSYQLAFAYAEAKNPKALALADSLIRMDSSETHAEPYYFKGIYYDNTGNPAQAIRFYDEAIRHDYYFIDAYLSKGEVLYNQKRWNEALKIFQLAATVSPTYADAYYWIGKTEEALGKKAEARLNYQRAYGLDKTLTEAKEAAERIERN